MLNEELSNYFARYNNFILLNSYLFLNVFEYEVNLILFVSFFFPFILKYDVDCFNLVFIAPMDENLVISETHQVVKRNCFNLNKLLQE